MTKEGTGNRQNYMIVVYLDQILGPSDTQANPSSRNAPLLFSQPNLAGGTRTTSH